MYSGFMGIPVETQLETDYSLSLCTRNAKYYFCIHELLSMSKSLYILILVIDWLFVVFVQLKLETLGISKGSWKDFSHWIYDSQTN